MANVPGVLIIGDVSVQGWSLLSSFVSSTGTGDLVTCKPGDVLRVVPDDPATGAPTATALNWHPWYDRAASDTLYTCASSGASTVTVSGSPGWTVNQWAGKLVTICNPFGVGFSDRKMVVSNTANQLTISGTWTSNPAAGVGVFIEVGRWRDYHPMAGWLAAVEVGSAISTRGGSSVQALGIGIGPDAGLLRELLAHVWTTAPYFQVAKYANAVPTTSAYDDTTGSLRTIFLAELARMASAWTALSTGNTLAWELLIVDQSQTDVLDWVANPAHYLAYEAALTQTIAWFRGASVLNNANLKVLIVNHADEVNNVTAATGTALANRVHRAVAAAGTNVRCVSLEGQPLTRPAPYYPALNRPAYEPHVYWDAMPRLLRQGYELLAAGNPPAFNGAVPVYLLIGDSKTTGPITTAYLSALLSPTITATARDARQMIYNRGNTSVEAYNAGDNSNTSGSSDFPTFSGPECSMLVELQALHPVTGCIIVKRGSNGSALIALLGAYTAPGAYGRWSKSYAGTEHYNQFLLDFRNTCNYVNRTLGKEVDLRGAFVDLGTNDQAVTGGGALFAAELATFVADLRADFSTRTSGKDLPIVWREPVLAAASAIYDESVAIRAALVDYAENDPQFALVNVDDLERDATDNLHDTPASCLEYGRRAVAAMATIAI